MSIFKFGGEQEIPQFVVSSYNSVYEEARIEGVDHYYALRLPTKCQPTGVSERDDFDRCATADQVTALSGFWILA